MSAHAGGALYRCRVGHARRKPFGHRFRYETIWLLMDVDQLDAPRPRSLLFAVDRLALFSLWRKDHGPRDGSSLRAWLDAALDDAGEPAAARIALLAMPRCLGWGFDPISIYFCYDANDRLRSIVHEVKNTFGGQRAYVLPADARPRVRQGCDKDFFVSPFIAMAARYEFDILPPEARLSVGIRERTARGLEFTAYLEGERAAFDRRALLRLAPLFLLQSFLVIGRIHWHALLLWWKGATFHSPSAHGASAEGPFRGPIDPRTAARAADERPN